MRVSAPSLEKQHPLSLPSPLALESAKEERHVGLQSCVEDGGLPVALGEALHPRQPRPRPQLYMDAQDGGGCRGDCLPQACGEQGGEELHEHAGCVEGGREQGATSGPEEVECLCAGAQQEESGLGGRLQEALEAVFEQEERDTLTVERV